MNPWISFSQLCEQGLILLSSALAVYLIYTGIQSSEVGHPHQMVATFYNLCISLDTRLPTWLYGVKLTELKTTTSAPQCVTTSLNMPVPTNILVLLISPSKGKF